MSPIDISAITSNHNAEAVFYETMSKHVITYDTPNLCGPGHNELRGCVTYLQTYEKLESDSSIKNEISDVLKTLEWEGSKYDIVHTNYTPLYKGKATLYFAIKNPYYLNGIFKNVGLFEAEVINFWANFEKSYDQKKLLRGYKKGKRILYYSENPILLKFDFITIMPYSSDDVIALKKICTHLMLKHSEGKVSNINILCEEVLSNSGKIEVSLYLY